MCGKQTQKAEMFVCAFSFEHGTTDGQMEKKRIIQINLSLPLASDLDCVSVANKSIFENLTKFNLDYFANRRKQCKKTGFTLHLRSSIVSQNRLSLQGQRNICWRFLFYFYAVHIFSLRRINENMFSQENKVF